MLRLSIQPSPHDFVTILAGGSGTRLWPMSRSAYPKQLLRLTGDRSLIQCTLDRVRLVVPPERILILTEGSHDEELRKQAAGVPEENIIVEPERRGTAAALALGASIIQQRDPDAVMASVHSDAYITDDAKFASTLLAALRAAEASETLVTLGIKPTPPSNQFGYIHAGEAMGAIDDFQLQCVKQFVEKPSVEVARTYLAEGTYYWNPGVFVWLTRVILDEFRALQPGIADVLSRIAPALGSTDQTTTLKQLYGSAPVETIDNGIMEQSKRVTVIPATFGWADIGGWSELYEILEKDPDGNVSIGNHLLLDTHNTLALSRDRLIATIGVDDLVIIDTGDAILIAPRDRAVESRRIVQELERQKRQDLL